MITIDKLKEYEEYHGFYDGFYQQKVKNNTNLTSDDEWYLINDLIQDVRLVKKSLAVNGSILLEEYNEGMEENYLK